MYRGRNGGSAGNGIYFADNPEATEAKAHHHGVVLECKVKLGNVKVINETDGNIKFGNLLEQGFDSVKLTCFESGPEYVVYNKDQVVEVEFWVKKTGSFSPPTLTPITTSGNTSNSNLKYGICIVVFCCIIIPIVTTVSTSLSRNMSSSTSAACFGSVSTSYMNNMNINGQFYNTAILSRNELGDGTTGVVVNVDMHILLEACLNCYYYLGFVGNQADSCLVPTMSKPYSFYATKKITTTGCYQIYFNRLFGPEKGCHTQVNSGTIVGAVFIQ